MSCCIPFTGSETEKPETKKEEESAESETKVPVKEEEPSEEKPEILSLQVIVKEELAELQRENRRLHNTATYLHQRHHEHTLEVGLTATKSVWGKQSYNCLV